MKKPRVVFRHFSGSGPLSIYWHEGPYGDAIEATKGRGVVWLAPNGELLGVEFDDVAWGGDERCGGDSRGSRSASASAYSRRGGARAGPPRSRGARSGSRPSPAP